MRPLVQMYALAVCFVVVMCFMIALGFGIYDLVQIAFPRFALSSTQAYQSNEAYLRYFPDKKDLRPDELTKSRERDFQDALDLQQHVALQSAVFVGIIVAIDIAVFALHWMLVRRERATALSEKIVPMP